jgi:hypothetical protein
VAQVECVRAAGRLRESRAREKAVDGGGSVHASDFAPADSSPS